MDKKLKDGIIDSITKTSVAMLTLVNELKCNLVKHGDAIDIQALHQYTLLSATNRELVKKLGELK